MKKLKIIKDCYKCFGTGVYIRGDGENQTEIDPCPACGGLKYILLSYVNVTPLEQVFDSIQAKLDTIIDLLSQ